MLMKGHVIMGDVAVTLVDLATRELLQIEPSPDEQGEEWIITSALESVPEDQRDAIATYEKTLLTGVAARLGPVATDIGQIRVCRDGRTRRRRIAGFLIGGA